MSGTSTCLCSAIHELAQRPDETQAAALIPALKRHLKDLQSLLSRSRTVSREVPFRITSSNDRVERALLVDSLDLRPVSHVYDRARGDPEWFWDAQDTLGDKAVQSVHAAIRRRFACIVVFLRSVLDVRAPVPSVIVKVLQGKYNYEEIRNAGRKYLKIARKLGGVGSLFWLPTDIPHTTYERYIHTDDEQLFHHLKTIGPSEEVYEECVPQLLTSQLQESLSQLSYYNLVVEHADVIPASCMMLLLLYSLGGSNIPSVVFEGVRSPQRRWSAQGEMEPTAAAEFGIPARWVDILCDGAVLEGALVTSQAVKQVTADKVVTWSIPEEARQILDTALLPSTREYLRGLALRVLCFICPPCLEGNLDWSVSLKAAVYPVLEESITGSKVSPPLRSHAIEALLYFAERDSVDTRRAAVALAKSLVRKSMPYYLHASVILFESILLRIDADFVKSEAIVRDFTSKGPKPTTRRDHCLLGRLHISQIENKIQLYDSDVASCIFKWEALQPQSSLDIEVTFRLQSTAARFFQSVGDFAAARASLNQLLLLDSAKPIRSNTRRLLVGRLADVCCEMQDYEEASGLLQSEMERCDGADRSRRWFRRLLLAQVETHIGLGQTAPADAILTELASTAPGELSDIHDEQLHVRRLVAMARLAHARSAPSDAIHGWQGVLEEVNRMRTLSDFAKAVVHLSLAHAQLLAGDPEAAHRSWLAGLDILQREKCEFWLPTVSTGWLRWIAQEVHRSQGWDFRMKQPGGKPDVAWPLP